MRVLQTLLPIILGHSPAGTSTRTVVHLSQGILSGRFRPYDYGSKKNMQIYNATEPPDYDFTNVTVPIALFYSDNDWLASNTVSRIIIANKKLMTLLPTKIIHTFVQGCEEAPWYVE